MNKSNLVVIADDFSLDMVAKEDVDRVRIKNLTEGEARDVLKGNFISSVRSLEIARVLGKSLGKQLPNTAFQCPLKDGESILAGKIDLAGTTCDCICVEVHWSLVTLI